MAHSVSITHTQHSYNNSCNTLLPALQDLHNNLQQLVTEECPHQTRDTVTQSHQPWQ